MKPEIDALKKRLNNDQQQVAVEQMKLFRESGVNQFGGCIPALLQIPIFFALYSFFNSNVELRSQHFLWSSDLSAYDSIVNIPNIPLIGSIYGTHVSLFWTFGSCNQLFNYTLWNEYDARPEQPYHEIYAVYNAGDVVVFL